MGKLQNKRYNQSGYRCFRCLKCGHQARIFEGKYRRNVCYKYGSDNHKSATCIGQVRGTICADIATEARYVEHVPGTDLFQVFSEVL